MGDYSHALADYDRSISLDPKRAGSYYDRGVARERHGDRDGAIKDYLEALRLDRNYAKPMQGLARLNWSGTIITTKQGQGISLPTSQQNMPPSSAPANIVRDAPISAKRSTMVRGQSPQRKVKIEISP